MLRDDDLGTAFVEIGDDGVAVESLVGDDGAKFDPVNQRGDADAVEAVARHQVETYEITQGVGQRENFGGHPPFDRPMAWL